MTWFSSEKPSFGIELPGIARVLISTSQVSGLLGRTFTNANEAGLVSKARFGEMRCAPMKESSGCNPGISLRLGRREAASKA